MPQPVRAVRLLVIVIACAATLILPTILASAFSSTAFRDLRTFELLAMVALLALPLATGLAVVTEQQARNRG
ncbi:MAG: hypothetical protein K2X32_15800 [Phycisphaerales bacterium]|nr:hypothetical protein [Phycisphaerales bacterium]